MRILVLGLLLAIGAGAQAHFAVDLGAAPEGLTMRQVLLLLRRTPQQSADLQKLLLEQQTPGTALYHHWLTPAAFGLRFGAPAAAQAAVESWLEQQGFGNVRVRPGGSVVSFDATAGAIATAFQTEIHRYQARSGERWGNHSPAIIPGRLQSLIAGVVALNNFPLASGTALGRGTGDLSQPGFPRPAFTYSNALGQPQHALVPADFGVLFQMQPLWATGLNGQGTSIAIVARSNINLSDVADFRHLFVPQDEANLPTVVVSGPDPGELHDGDEYEAILDSEWAGALAPAAQVKIVVSAGTAATDGIILSAQAIVEQDLADVMSLSYTACEAQIGSTENQFWNSLFEQAAAEGISVVVSSGDSGAAGCDSNAAATPAASHGLGVNGLASTPWDTAVGGTRLLDRGTAGAAFWSAANNAQTHGSALMPIPQTAWNDSCLDPTACDPAAPLSASGGGDSYLYPKPAWQQGVGDGGMREVPDLAFSASSDDGYLVCADASCHTDPGGLFGYFIVGGTSAAAPAFAALMALADEQAGGPQGLANPTLYRLAQAVPDIGVCDASLGAAVAPDCVFADIRNGNNAEPCQVGSPGCETRTDGTSVLPGYSAVAGYDRVSGLGSPLAANLVRAWSGAAARTATQTHLQWEQQSESRVQVCVQGRDAGVPTGTAAIMQVGADGAQRQLALANLADAAGQGCGTWSTAQLPGGDYALQARYSGDDAFAPSLSDPVAVSAPLVATQSRLTAYIAGLDGPLPTHSAPYGSALQFAIQVRGSSALPPPAGTTRLENRLAGPHQQRGARGMPQAQLLAQWPLNAQGLAVAPAGLLLPPGMYSLVAAYDGDTGYGPSHSPAYPLSIERAATSVALDAEPSSSFIRLGATVTAAGAAAAPSGDVEFFAATRALGFSPLVVAAATADGSGEVAAVAHFFAPAGYSGRYSARYLGDSNFLASAPFTLSAAADSLTIVGGGNAQLPITLSPVGDFQATVALSCTVVPAGPACSISPGQLDLKGREASALLRLGSPAAAGMSPGVWWWWLGLWLCLAVAWKRTPRLRLIGVAGCALLAAACGGSPRLSRPAATPGVYQVVVRAATPVDSSLLSITLDLR